MSDPGIDGKICGKSHSGASGKGTAGHCNNTTINNHSTSPIEAKDLGLHSILGVKGIEKWPKIAGTGSISSSNAYTVDASPEVAKDIISLTKDEKVKVAGHLAKSIEGGEVVERIATKYSALRRVVGYSQCRILHKERFRSGS